MRTENRCATLHFAVLTFAAQSILVALFFRPVLIGHSTLIRDWDSADQTFCWLNKVFAAIQQGQLVLWDFGSYSGISFIGELQTGPLYPPALLFGLFARIGDPTHVDFYHLFHFFVAALGMQALARGLRLPWLAGLGGAIVYGYGSVFTLRVGGQGNIFVGLTWIPWAAAAAQWAMTARTLRQTVSLASAAGLTISLAFLGGHIASAIYLAIAVCAFGFAPVAIALLRRNRAMAVEFIWRALIVIMTAWLVAILISLPQIIASEEYLRLSYKWYGSGYTSYPHVVPYEEYLKWSLQGRDLLTIFTAGEAAPEGGTLFVTWIGAACAALALVAGVRRRGSEIEPVIVAGGAMLVLALAMGFASVPPFGWLFYHLPVVNLLRIPSRATCLYAFAAAVLAMGGLAIICNAVHRRMADLEPRLAFIVSRVVIGALALLLVLEARSFNRATTRPLNMPESELTKIIDGDVTRALVGLSRSEPPVYRYFGPRELVPPNLPDIYPIFSTTGFRSSMTIAYKDYVDFNPASPRMDALGVRWWVTNLEVPDLPLIKTVGNARIYERPTALPVFSLAEPSGRLAAAPIEHVEWGVNSVTVRFSQPISGRLIFAQTLYPGWTVVADGSPYAVREDRELLSVILPDLTRTVTFTYAPVWFAPSLVIALLTLAWIGIFAVSAWRIKEGSDDLLPGIPSGSWTKPIGPT